MGNEMDQDERHLQEDEIQKARESRDAELARADKMGEKVRATVAELEIVRAQGSRDAEDLRSQVCSLLLGGDFGDYERGCYLNAQSSFPGENGIDYPVLYRKLKGYNTLVLTMPPRNVLRIEQFLPNQGVSL